MRAGVLTRLWRGFYTTGAAIDLPDPRGVTRSMRVVLSHESAAAWSGVDLPNVSELLHITAPRSRGRVADVAPGIRLHRRDVVDSDIVRLRGVRITCPARTITDIARRVPTAHAVAVADSYLRRSLITTGQLRAYADFQAAGPGKRRVRRVCELVDPRAGSVFESISRVLFVEGGLPRPITQLNVKDRKGRWIGRVDFAWPEAKVIVECDGFEFHSGRDSFEKDRRRWSELTRAGWRVIVITWSQVTSEPEYVLGLVADLLGVPHRSSTQLGLLKAVSLAG